MASWKKNPVYHGDDLSGFVDPNWCCSNCGGRAPIVIGLGLYDLVDTCPRCGGPLSELRKYRYGGGPIGELARYHGQWYRHCYSCHAEFFVEG